MIQIETLAGIENLDAILTECPDIDAVWLGTLDCRISMNMPGNSGFGGAEPEWLEAVAKYESILIKHNKPRGGFALGPPEVMTAMGSKLSFITVAADIVQLVGLGQELAKAREAFPPTKKGEALPDLVPAKKAEEEEKKDVEGGNTMEVVNGTVKA